MMAVERANLQFVSAKRDNDSIRKRERLFQVRSEKPAHALASLTDSDCPQNLEDAIHGFEDIHHNFR